MNLVEIFALLGLDVTMRQAAQILFAILCLLSCITGMLGMSIVTGEAILLGKKYGKKSLPKSILSPLLMTLSVLFGIAYLFFYITYMLSYFFKIIPTSMLMSIIIALAGIVAIVLSWFVGIVFRDFAEEKRDAKYKHEIDEILMDNPVFVATLNTIKSDNNIKMVKIFRDGISFHDTVTLPPENETVEIKYGSNSQSEADMLVKSRALGALASEGSAHTSGEKSVLLYSNYGFSNSETAMIDLRKWLFNYLKPRFLKRDYKKTWSYSQTIASGPTGYVVNGNTVTPTGSSTKTISSSQSELMYLILYTKQEQSISAPPRQNLTQW